MQSLKIVAMPTQQAEGFRAGGLDANGQPSMRELSSGPGNPCRHCLANIEEGEEKLVLSYRPFPKPQAFAETGPIFLHAKSCERYPEVNQLPDLFSRWPVMIARGYDQEDRIAYGTGNLVPIEELEQTCQSILSQPEVAYMHLRAPGYNCYQCRLELA